MLYTIINLFNTFLETFNTSGVNATEISPMQHHLYLNVENTNFEVWELSTLINTKLCLFLSFQLFFLLMYLNHKLYSRENRSTRRKIKSKYPKSRKGINAKNRKSKIDFKKFISKLFLITIFKCLLMAIIFFSNQTKAISKSKEYIFYKRLFSLSGTLSGLLPPFRTSNQI